MQARLLKRLRVTLAACFFLLTVTLFVDFREFGMRIIADQVLFLQFIPSCLRFFNSVAVGSAGCIAVLGITLLFGRVYCSTICPLGTGQDLISRLTHKRSLHKKKTTLGRGYRFSRPHSRLRYAMLSLTVLLLLTGNGLVLNLLDPFSSFGRIVANLVRPLVLGLNNLGAMVAESMGSTLLYQVQWPAVAPISVGISLAVLILVGWLSATHGRLYCNTLCPVGTLLGLLARFSLFRLRFAAERCIHCGRCEGVCKAGCINIDQEKIDLSRCVSCYNCLSVCPTQAIKIGKAQDQFSASSRHPSGRRQFILTLMAGGIGLLAEKAEAGQQRLSPLQARPTTLPEKRTCPIAPPGSISVEHFTSRCTACHLCVSACPSQVLTPSFLAYGLSSIMQPQLDFRTAHCNFDCTICSEVCPSGAISPLTREDKKRTQVGVAQFIRENCVVYTDKTNCGACSEHCPTKAVHMVPYLETDGRKLRIPEVNRAICVGCGGCEHACPTRPYRAIYVDGNPVHKPAEKPAETPVLPSPQTSEDFPF